MANIKDIVSTGVQNLEPYVPGKTPEQLSSQHEVSDVIKLASNENPMGFSESTRYAIEVAISSVDRYPDGSGFNLKSKLSTLYQIQTNQITLGNGSNDVIELIARGFLEPDQRVVISQHAFAVYYLVSKAINAEICIVPANNYGHDLDGMIEALNSNTKIIFIANPNNPTGTYVKASDLLEFMNRVPSNILVVLDEAYFEYVSVNDYPDSISMLKNFNNLIITRSFSKAYGLAGLRIGYAMAAPEVTDILNRVRQPFNVNSLALAAAEAAIADQDFIQKSRICNQKGMIQLCDGFQNLGLKWIPSIGNFICVSFQTNSDKINDILLKNGVIVRPVKNYDLPNHLRITVGSESENRKLLSMLKLALDLV